MHKLSLYIHTAKYLKPSQIFYRILRQLQNKLYNPYIREADVVAPVNADISYIIPELDLSPDYLNRFNIEELLNNTFTFLNLKKQTDLKTGWNDPSMPRLWIFHLHYFEYLYALADAYNKTHKEQYYEKYKEIIEEWIKNNPIGTGNGWHPYTISLRLTNWICTFQLLYDTIKNDFSFQLYMLKSLYTQYNYLRKNIEKNNRGNHYMENLKALILGSIFFKQEKPLSRYLEEFNRQLEEQILPDGMHFELSPMYHNIMLEAVMKVHYWQRQDHVTDTIAKMLDVTYSLEKNTGRLPFFNDCSQHTAKSTKSLIHTAERYFGIKPRYKARFEASGYYILDTKFHQCIIDAGKIGVDYLPGHAHCDALSYELAVHGRPVIVNSGTYTYEPEKWRDYFRSTRAHNTLAIDDTEQSQYWGSFRVAKRIRYPRGNIEIQNGIRMFKGSYFNYKGQKHIRYIMWLEQDIFLVLDKVEAPKFRYTKSYIHLHPKSELMKDTHWQIIQDHERIADIICIHSIHEKTYKGGETNGWYSPEFGLKYENHVLEIHSQSTVSGYIINFSDYPVEVQCSNEQVTVRYNGTEKQIPIK